MNQLEESGPLRYIREEREGHFLPFFKVLNTFPDVVWHVSWSITGDILAVSGGDHKVSQTPCEEPQC